MNFNREELEMLQDDSGGTFGSAYVKQLAAEVQRLRDKLAVVHDVWEGALDGSTSAHVVWCGDGFTKSGPTYTRTLPKTIDETLLDEFLPLEGDDKVMSPSTARHKARGMLAEYKARTEGKQ